MPWVTRAGAGARTPPHSRRVPIATLPLLLLALLTCALLPSAALAAAAPDAAARIDSILHKRHLDNDGTAVFVWDLQTATALYARNASTPLAPASNMKLLTTAAALESWGRSYRIPTDVLVTDEPSVGGVLHGDLYLRGNGDPSLSTRWYRDEVLDLRTGSIEGLAAKLKKAGLTRVRGAVVGDDSYFDDDRTVISWKPGLQDECGRLSALSSNEGLRRGKRLKDPALQAAKALTKALRNAGVKVDDAPRHGVAPSDAQALAQQLSGPLAALIRHMDKESDNFFAEILVKGLGADLYGEGSTDAGLQASRDVLDRLGADPDSYRLTDGSGLSYDDRLTTGDLVRLLIAMHRRDDFTAFYKALAVAGKDGTLEDRMRHTPAAGNARAKTGSLAIAAALSGYVTSADGHLLAFSIISNARELNYWSTAKAHDAIVAALASSRPGGATRLRDTPVARQHVQGAADCSFVTGRALVPSPEVP